MRRLILGLVLAIALAAPALAANLLVDPVTATASWSGYLGWEFPGATSTTTTVRDLDRGQCLEGRFSFGYESRYAGLYWTGEIRSAKAIGFWVRLADRDGGMLRLRDSTGQEHVAGFSAPPGKWTRIEVEVKPEAFPTHWQGPDDGVFRLPIVGVLVGVSRGPDQAALRLSSLYVVSDDIRPEERCGLAVEPNVPMGVAFPDEKAGYWLRVLNRLEVPMTAAVEVEAQTPGAKAARILSRRLALGAWQETALPLPLPTKALGYRCIRARVADAAGPAPRQLCQSLSGLVVVPRPRHYGKPAPDCYFGLQVIPDMEAAERLGAKALRNAPGWVWAEPSPGRIQWEGYYDGCVKPAREHGMELLLTLQPNPPAWAAWHVDGKPLLAGLPDPAKLDLWREHCRQVAAHYRGQIRAIEIANEPDLTCQWQPGIPFAEGVDYYCKLLRAGYEGVKAGDPGCLVAGCDVSGGDFDGGLPFTRAVYDRATSLLDLYTGHPYSGVRYFGPDQRPLWPVQNTMHERCVRALQVLRAHGKPARMWIGELGWGLLNTADPLSGYSTDFAACMAQALILGKSVRGVGKFLWFTLQGCNEGGYEYGLMRGQPAYPLPAAMAYATAAYLLEPTEPAGPAVARGDLWRAAFVCRGRGELVVAFWSVGDGVRVARPPAAPVGRWYDSFLQPLLPSGQGMAVGRLPVYWVLPLAKTGERPAFLDRLTVRAPEPFAVRHVFIAALDRLGLLLDDKTGADQRLTVSLQGRSVPVRLPGGAQAAREALPLSSPLPVGRAFELPVVVAGGGASHRVVVRASLDAMPPPPAGLRLDADLSEWAGLKPFVLRDRSQVLPADPGIGWDGPGDLSARAWLAADAQALYFAADVTDDVMAVPFADPGNFWGSDSVQIALDPLDDSPAAFDANDREVGFVLAADGPRAFITYPAPFRRADLPAAIRREGTHTVYEVRVPWDRIGVARPAPGQVMALDFIINDNDGQGRSYWIGLTPGIGEGKSPASYRKFVVSAPS